MNGFIKKFTNPKFLLTVILPGGIILVLLYLFEKQIYIIFNMDKLNSDSHENKAGATLGERFNNIMNLWQSSNSWLGKVNIVPYNLDTIEKFTSFTLGLRAGIKNLNSLFRVYKNISATINAYAPPNVLQFGKTNDTNAYINNVCSWTGFSPTDEPDMSDKDTVQLIVTAICRQENSYSLTDDEFNAAYKLI